MKAWLLLLALPAAASASDFGQVRTLAQDQFKAVAQDLGAAFSYKGVTPGTSLGVLGFDVGVEASDTKIEDVAALRAAGNDASSHVVISKVHVHKGLWGGFDIGAFVGATASLGATLYGADLRYAIVEESLASPGFGLRLSGTRATGLGDLKIDAAAFDALVSKRFALVTPYAGAGVVRTNASVSGSGLSSEGLSKGRIFAGLNLNLLAANLAFEAEKLGDNTSLSAKVGFRF